MTTIHVLNYRGDILYGLELGGVVYVAVKPIAEAMGLNWSGQEQRLKRDPILSEGICVTHIPSGRGGSQAQLCLRLDMLNGWLFKIDSKRVKESTRERVQAYQRECYGVLYAHFTEEGRKALHDRNETESMKIRMVTEARQTFGPEVAAQLWQELRLPVVPAMGTPSAQGDLFGRHLHRELIVA